ncbi:MAG: fibronectin type III domain-containing protein, partial [Alistipes sp.]|nr:fibronectin type III domain-containing protein [Alistipes senegalensis]MCM1249706.1 fibronectin type III domain-containing protein [Alistipes sp.]
MKKTIFWLCLFLSAWGCGSDGTDPAISAAALEAPVPVVAMQDSRATVTWQAVAHADRYFWELTEGEDSAPLTGTSVVAYCAFSMEEGMTYRFRVRAQASADSGYADSPWSSYVSFTTRVHTQLPAPVAEASARTASG